MTLTLSLGGHTLTLTLAQLKHLVGLVNCFNFSDLIIADPGVNLMNIKSNWDKILGY